QQRFPQRYVMLAIVADHGMVTKYSGNSSAITTRVHQMVSHVTEMYSPLNIATTLSLLRIWSSKDLITVQSDSSVTLGSFGDWRKVVLLSQQAHDCAFLNTATALDDSTIGLAYSNGMCDPKFSVGLVQDHSSNVFMVAVTMTHELGHNLGMAHDEAGGCACSSCIMSPAASSGPSKLFSDCSKDDYQTFLTNTNPQCILNAP
uniref:Snake venom metalloproteinase TM-1 n=1 Tax=Protobothrops mucrosquamatus TaxID=103944 RepID=VM1T1_PROMU|nr:RecName: Full=Snake venom metalloproteinase TM-1; Short=SVMP; AltName: Full=Zinc-dependent metalloproteinase [Protobothrops mucrosquamatus]4J4M_A Chain A, zinc-dependent metalloproteinase [Protobothrops mucrosquamatus]4J4M_B Chain B, zinc-dependent metalloproteinase [Protobothrops mucrosquamatus]